MMHGLIHIKYECEEFVTITPCDFYIILKMSLHFLTSRERDIVLLPEDICNYFRFAKEIQEIHVADVNVLGNKLYSSDLAYVYIHWYLEYCHFIKLYLGTVLLYA